MRAVVQRVLNAKVEVDGNVIADIDQGLLILLGVKDSDDHKVYEYMLDKIINLRIFEDDEDKMNLSLIDIEGDLLIVPNFTLYGDCRKGRRPSYIAAAKPDNARSIFNDFMNLAKDKYHKTQQGQFQADMKVSLINDGPVTLLIDSDKEF